MAGGSEAAATAEASASDNPFPLLGDLPQIAQEKNVVI